MPYNPDFVYDPPMYPLLPIVHADDDLLVLNKVSGLLSVRGRALAHQDSLESRVQRVYPTATIIHRLDMATSGLIVMPLNMDTHRALSRQFAERQTRKAYLARVYGEVTQSQGSIDRPLIVDWPNRPKQKVDEASGKPSLTHFQKVSGDGTSSLMLLQPVTGRSHQLRVHMLELGHPILGDRLYGEPYARYQAPRLQLHAWQLGFFHPGQQQWVQFRSDAPFASNDELEHAATLYMANN
ncbi:pseudouridine synthase [Aestuariibacter salexigens]|uniref:pseudouridine synthase n=1 Tax=Aestuariibacter salexigens TaxID=226010 RepID=UPI00041FB413|nr:pseudouridine synthase [Aestuariibacter salexigens]